MARKSRPTGKQLLRQYLKMQIARSALRAQQSALTALAEKACGHDEVVEHDGRIYKVRVSYGVFPVVGVENLGTVAEFNSLLGEAGS